MFFIIIIIISNIILNVCYFLCFFVLIFYLSFIKKYLHPINIVAIFPALVNNDICNYDTSQHTNLGQ